MSNEAPCYMLAFDLYSDESTDMFGKGGWGIQMYLGKHFLKFKKKS